MKTKTKKFPAPNIQQNSYQRWTLFATATDTRNPGFFGTCDPKTTGLKTWKINTDRQYRLPIYLISRWNQTSKQEPNKVHEPKSPSNNTGGLTQGHDFRCFIGWRSLFTTEYIKQKSLFKYQKRTLLCSQVHCLNIENKKAESRASVWY